MSSSKAIKTNNTYQKTKIQLNKEYNTKINLDTRELTSKAIPFEQ